MALNQTKTIQLLRSSQAYADIEAAKTAIKGLAGERKDGEILLGRYWSGTGSNAEIKSVLAVYHAAPNLTGNNITAGTTKGWTFIQDITSSSEGLQALQNEVDAIETALGFNGDGTKGAFSDTDALQIIAANDTIAAAVEKVAKALGALDKTASAVDGKVVTTVSQSNGLVSEAKENLTDIKMSGYSKTSDTGAIAATDTLEVAVSKLENGIAAATVKSTDKTVNITDNSGKDLSVNIDGTTLVKNSGTGVISSNLKIIKETTGLDANVKEQYKLVYGSDTTEIGAPINIYKDSALLSVKLLHATDSLKPTYNKSTDTWTDIASPTEANLALCYAYENANGVVVVEAVPVGNFLRESEFKDGLQVTNGVVTVKVGDGLEFGSEASGNKSIKVKIDSTSESFLTVGANGVKLSGVQNAIDAVKVSVTNNSDYITTSVDNAGRVITIDETVQAMATADSTHQGLAEASDVKSYVDAAVAGKNVTAEGDDYVSATAANNKVTVATDVQNLTFTQGSGSTDSTLSGTAQSLADGSDIATKVSSFTNARISEEIAKLDSSVAATAEANNQYSVLTGVTETDGKLTAKTEVTLAAVAKTGAAADVSVTDTEGKLTSTNVEDALAEIVDKADASLNSVSSTNGAIAVGTKDSNKNQALTFQVSASCAKQGDGTTNMLTIANDGLVLSDTWDCGTF